MELSQTQKAKLLSEFKAEFGNDVVILAYDYIYMKTPNPCVYVTFVANGHNELADVYLNNDGFSWIM